MKFKELKVMGEKELEDKLTELNMVLMKANTQVSTGTNPKDPGQIKHSKKTIARIKTLLTQKEAIKKQ